MTIKIDGFDWDEGNSSKNEIKHGIPQSVVECFFLEKIWIAPDPTHSLNEERFLAIGKEKGGRYLIVAFTFRIKNERRLIRPISARYMNRREILKYEKTFTQSKK